MPRKLKKFTAAQFAAHIRELSINDAKFDNKFRPFTTTERGVPKMSDAELPNLFRAIDGIAERVFLKSVGL